MKILQILALLCTTATAQIVQLPPVFKTIKGIEIKNAKVTGSTESAIKVMHDGGIATIQHNQLPPEVLQILGIEGTPQAEPEIALPDPLVTAKTSYEKPQLTAIDPDGIRIKHPLGSAKVRYEDLPPSVLPLVGPFDPSRAESFRKAEEERNRDAYAQARKAIEDAQRAGAAPDIARQKELDELKAALMADPNLISPTLALEIIAYSSGGKSRDTTYATTWGSFARTETSKREMYCTVRSKTRGLQRARLQCIFLTRDVSGSRDMKAEVVADAKVSLGPEATKQVAATAKAEQSNENYAAIGIRYREGEKYVGWCWRAIDGQDRICAVYSSMASYDRYAWNTPVDSAQ